MEKTWDLPTTDWHRSRQAALNAAARPPEKRLYKHLSTRPAFAMLGPVRHNHPITFGMDDFFADICFVEADFIIEVDAEEFHSTAAQKRMDELRPEKSCTLGFLVMRVKSSEVMTDFGTVVVKVKLATGGTRRSP
jgi:very-short-patch-repair endonuclease